MKCPTALVALAPLLTGNVCQAEGKTERDY
jgi:hypothetical protein